MDSVPLFEPLRIRQQRRLPHEAINARGIRPAPECQHVCEGKVGFGGSVTDLGKDKAIKALNDFLRPEFINRIDEIVYFNRLSEENIREIAKLMLSELDDVMKEKKITFSYDDALLDYLTEKGYSLTYGARNLRRLIQKEIEDAVASEIIDRRHGMVASVHVTVVDGKPKIETA